MTKTRLKNLVILVLVLSACIQTGRLWLGEGAGRAFFYSVLEALDFDDGTKAPESIALAPNRLVVGSGNKRFSLLCHGADTISLEDRAADLLGAVFTDGTFVSSGTADWSTYLDGRCLVLEYAIDVSAEEFIKGFSGRGKAVLAQVSSFDTVVLLPAGDTGGESRAVFLRGDSAAVFALSGSDAATALDTAIEGFSTSGRLSYISAKQNGLYLFPDATFLPQWQSESWSYPVLKKINPFVADAGGDMTAPLKGYFTNYAATSQELDPETGGYVISDSTRVVKYYPAGVLEYYDYESTSKTDQTLATAYTACIEFLTRQDLALTTDFTLSDVSLRSDGLTFSFDYAAGGLPIYLSDSLKQELGLEHAMEVVVQNNRVRKYKKLAYYFKLSTEETDTVETDFLSVLDQAIADTGEGQTVTQVEDIRLGYLADKETNVRLRWFVTMDGAVCEQDTHRAANGTAAVNGTSAANETAPLNETTAQP